MCVCGGGGGGGGELLTSFFNLQIAKRRRSLCGLVALADSCWGKKDNYIYIHHHQEFFTII